MNKRNIRIVTFAVVVLVVLGAWLGGSMLRQRQLQATKPGPAPSSAPHVQVTKPADNGAFPDTENGAVRAAASYTSLLASSMLVSPQERRTILSAIVAKDHLQEMLVAYNHTAPNVRQALGLAADSNDPRAYYQVQILQYSVKSYSAASIDLTFFTKSVLGLSDNSAYAEQFGLTDIALVWSDGSWKYMLASPASTGPAPAGDGTPPTAAAFRPYLTDYKEYSDGAS